MIETVKRNLGEKRRFINPSSKIRIYCNYCGDRFLPPHTASRFCKVQCIRDYFKSIAWNRTEYFKKRYDELIKTDMTVMEQRRVRAREYKRRVTGVKPENFKVK